LRSVTYCSPKPQNPKTHKSAYKMKMFLNYVIENYNKN